MDSRSTDECGLSAHLQGPLGIQRTVKLDQFGNQAGPASLMASAEPGAVVTVEVFVKEDVIAPVWIVLELLRAAVDGPMAMLVAGEYPGEPVGDLTTYLE